MMFCQSHDSRCCKFRQILVYLHLHLQPEDASQAASLAGGDRLKDLTLLSWDRKLEHLVSRYTDVWPAEVGLMGRGGRKGREDDREQGAVAIAWGLPNHQSESNHSVENLCMQKLELTESA